MKTVDEALAFAERVYSRVSDAGIIAAEVRRLREENERLRNDAERYRWFRVNENWRDSGPFDEFYEADLDVAIDAARGAK